MHVCCLIHIKLGENDFRMRWWLSTSFMRIGQKIVDFLLMAKFWMCLGFFYSDLTLYEKLLIIGISGKKKICLPTANKALNSDGLMFSCFLMQRHSVYNPWAGLLTCIKYVLLNLATYAEYIVCTYLCRCTVIYLVHLMAPSIQGLLNELDISPIIHE